MKKLIGSTIVGSVMILGPLIALAQTSTTSNTQIQSMLVQIQALQTQIKAMQEAQKQLQTARTNVATTLGLLRSLKQGMSGSDVSALQAILSADPTIYPEGLVSGFYGRLTSEAVKKFQRRHGFESVGFVGPKTLKKLNEMMNELGLSEEDDDNDEDNDNNRNEKRLCAKIPPGHLIALGWLKKNNGQRPIVPECQTLPGGISKKDEDWWHKGSTTLDKLVPTISLVGASNLLGTTTNIIWMTNENSNSKVWFGTSTPISTSGTANVTDSNLVKNHSIPLSGLSTSTIYYFIVGSTDSSNNTATSSQNSFVTTSGL